MKHNLRLIIEAALTGLLLLTLMTALARKSTQPKAAVAEQAVVLNTRLLIYHCPACELIRHCGADCVTVDISEARRRGARPCVSCGGICLAKR